MKGENMDNRKQVIEVVTWLVVPVIKALVYFTEGHEDIGCLLLIPASILQIMYWFALAKLLCG